MTRNVLKRSYISSYGVDENKPQSEEVKEDDEKMEDNLIPEEVAPFSCSKQLFMISQLMLFLVIVRKNFAFIAKSRICLLMFSKLQSTRCYQSIPTVAIVSS